AVELTIRSIDAAGERKWRLPGAAWALVAFLVMAVALFSSAWANPTSRIIGVCEDPLQFIWFFTWPAYDLTHGQNPFITRPIDYPTAVNLMWNSISPLSGVVTWPVRAVFGPILNFDLVETLAPALS